MLVIVSIMVEAQREIIKVFTLILFDVIEYGKSIFVIFFFFFFSDKLRS
jgi:hypothetical protein